MERHLDDDGRVALWLANGTVATKSLVVQEKLLTAPFTVTVAVLAPVPGGFVAKFVKVVVTVKQSYFMAASWALALPIVSPMVPSATAVINANAETVFFICAAPPRDRDPTRRRHATTPPNFRRPRKWQPPTWFGRCSLGSDADRPAGPKRASYTRWPGPPRISSARILRPVLYSARIYSRGTTSPGGCRMRTEDLILVSVDDHVVEPPSLAEYLADHVPAKYKDRVPRVIRRDDGTDAWLIEGQEIASFGLNAVQGRPRESWGADPASFDQVRPGTFDVHERIRDMNVNGVLASLNFPSWPGLGGQFFVQNDDTEFVEVMIRAYNDWHIDEWCGAYPGRFIPLALSGFVLGDEWMAGEIHRVAEKGCHAVSFHSEPHRFGTAGHPRRRSGTTRGRRATTSAPSRCSTSAASRTSCRARRSR